jgi:UDPglucose 6-dehydrogenase
MNICIIGTGYVGLVSGACFAEKGHHVVCVDNNKKKVEMLQRGEIPIFEPGLDVLVKKNILEQRLSFTDSLELGIKDSLVVFIAVPTPPQADGGVDLTYIEQVSREIADVIEANKYKVIVDKSTVPVKTGEKVKATIRRYNKKADIDVVSNPEFLKEGCAIEDLMNPDRIVIGSSSSTAIGIMKELYKPFNAPIMVTDINSAELIKHAANSFLSLKISYINAVAAVCEASDADVEMVADGIGADKRIGRNFLNAGLGYGGSCFPKDVKAFIAISEELGVPFNLLKEVEQINANQLERFIKKIKDALWVLKDKSIAVWGLTFKSNTDDVRNSVAIELVNRLASEGAIVTAYDPKGMEKAVEYKLLDSRVKLVNSPSEATIGAEALIIATEWKEFIDQNFAEIKTKMHTPLIFDGRNLLNPKNIKSLGFVYYAVGRSN